jgi:TolB protein
VIAALLMLAADPAPLTQVRDSYPGLSSDGTQLLFHSNRGGPRAIWIAKGDGSEPRLLYDGGDQGDDPATPVWSPDGRSIAFAMKPADAADADESDIYVMDADGSNVRRLTDAPGDDSHPHWSGDGRRIFFNSPRATPDPAAEWSRQHFGIYSIAADGSDLERHLQCNTVCTYPSPSPDGRRILFRKVVDGPGFDWELKDGVRNSEVFVADMDGSNQRNLSNHPGFDGWPVWSPDSRWIAFASNRAKVARIGQIFRVRPDGSGLEALSDTLWSRVQPSFAADRSLLVNEGRETAAVEISHIARIVPAD